MDECDNSLATISLMLDREPVEGADQEALKAHLGHCASCRTFARQMSQLDRVMRQAPLKYAPSGFTERAVSRAMSADRGRDQLLGFVVLLLCVAIFASLLLTGNADLMWSVLNIIVSPGFSGGLWLQHAFESAIVFVGVVGQLLLGPLFLTVMLPTLLVLALLVFFQWRQRNRLASPPA